MTSYRANGDAPDLRTPAYARPQVVGVVVGMTHCRIKMLDDTDNKKELEMRRT